MGQLRARRAAGRGPVTARGAEVLVPPYVTARADDAARLQPRVEVGVGDALPLHGGRGALLGVGRVAARAGASGGRFAPNHLRDLPRDARAHALRVERGPPVTELHGMASAAGLGLVGALNRREAGRG